MKEIIAIYGWPTATLVSDKGNYYAWLIVQHADHDIKSQKMILKKIKKAAEQTSESWNQYIPA